MLRRIGAIEERVTQRVLAKILFEMETTQSSETRTRLRRYHGALTAGSADTGNTAAGDEGSNEGTGVAHNNHRSPTELPVDPPSARDVAGSASQDPHEDDSDDECVFAESQLAVVHPDAVRQTQRNINRVSGSPQHSSSNNSKNCSVRAGSDGGRGGESDSSGALSTPVAAAAMVLVTTPLQRKHATASL